MNRYEAHYINGWCVARMSLIGIAISKVVYRANSKIEAEDVADYYNK